MCHHKNLIANYTLDIKLAKANLLNLGSAPEYPNTEWRSILSGLPTNLDAAFSGQYSTEHESKISQEIGDYTISTREASTSKSTKSAGDWFIAWNQTAEATSYVFPHQEKECQEYGRHILGLFAAFAEELRLSTSPGYPQLTTGIPMGKPAGMETRRSESLVITGLCGSGCCKYLPRVLVGLIFYLAPVFHQVSFYQNNVYT